MVIGVEIERFAVIVAGFRLLAGGVAHQTHEMKSVRRWTVLSQMRFATGCRFDEAPPIGEPSGFVNANLMFGGPVD